MTGRALRSLAYGAAGMTVFVGLIPRLIAGAGLELLSFHSAVAGVGGAVIVSVGAWVYVACVWDFVTRGRGTPAFWEPPRALVARRLFLRVRNPMYIGVAMINVGQALIVGSAAVAVYAVVLTACFHAFVVLYEEPYLHRRFGELYAEYKRRVPRWLPRLTDGRGHEPRV